ncbi:hypothetical protein ACHAXN_009004 [Cyclotella atomus]
MKVTAVFTSLLLAFAAADGKRNVQRLRSGDNGRRLAKGAKRARLPVAKVAMCHYEIDSVCPYKTIEIGETGLEAHTTNYVDDREGSCDDHCIEDGQMYDLDTCTCHSEDEGEGEDHDETEDEDHDGTDEVRDGGVKRLEMSLVKAELPYVWRRGPG